MSLWVWAAAIFGAVLCVAALTQPVRHRLLVLVSCLVYSGLAVLAGGRESLLAQVVAPGGLLLAGYWLSGLFYRDPQPWLERRLLSADRLLGAGRWRGLLPPAANGLLEASYASVPFLVGGGAIAAASHGTAAATHYWSLVLPAELACYVSLPWLRARPPRTLEGRDAGQSVDSAGVLNSPIRRLNLAVLRRVSVQATTLPSGHVAGALAAALATFPLNATAGWMMSILAVLIAIAAAVGRYHYVADCVTGAAVSLLFWSALRW